MNCRCLSVNIPSRDSNNNAPKVAICEMDSLASLYLRQADASCINTRGTLVVQRAVDKDVKGLLGGDQ